MRYRQWQDKLNASEGEHLPLLSIILLCVQILSFVRNPTVIGPDAPIWLLVVDFLLLAFTSGIVLWVRGRDIPRKIAHPLAAALFIMAGVSAVISIAAQKDPLAFYFAIVLLSGSLCFLSQRYLLFSLGTILLIWFPVALLVLTPTQIISTLLVSAVGVTLSLYIMRRRILSMINVYQLETRVIALESILPMCASCKKTRDSSGEWQSIEQYIEDQQEGTQISHGSCPSCTEKLYGQPIRDRALKRAMA